MASVTDNEYIYVYIVGFIGGIVNVLGIIGNLLNLLVLMRQEMRRTNFGLFLIIIAVYDLFYLVGDLITTSFNWAALGVDPTAMFSLDYVIPASVVVNPVTLILVVGSIYCTAILSIDRCMTHIKPLVWSRIATRRKTVTALVVVFFWAVIINAPFFFEFEYKNQEIPFINKTILTGEITEYFFSNFHQNVYLQWIFPITQTLIPFVIILICDIAMAIKMCIERRRRNARINRAVIPCTRGISTTSFTTLGHANGAHENQGFYPTSEMSANEAVATTTTSGSLFNTDGGGHESQPEPAKTVLGIIDSNSSSSSSSDDIPTSSTTSQDDGIDRKTLQVVCISAVVMASRIVQTIFAIIMRFEKFLLLQYCSQACAVSGALNLLFVKINASAKFIFYCLVSRKFRSELKAVMCCSSRESNLPSSQEDKKEKEAVKEYSV